METFSNLFGVFLNPVKIPAIRGQNSNESRCISAVRVKTPVSDFGSGFRGFNEGLNYSCLSKRFG
jgi:hypothetical protein